MSVEHKIERKLRVVIIDDYDMTRTLLGIILRGGKFEIIGEATDGVQGIDMCLRLKPDLVLLDIIMPNMNGIAALEQIHKALPDTMVLMVSGADDTNIVEQAVQKGASGYIIKPFNTANVLETLDAAHRQFVLRGPAKVQF